MYHLKIKSFDGPNFSGPGKIIFSQFNYKELFGEEPASISLEEFIVLGDVVTEPILSIIKSKQSCLNAVELVAILAHTLQDPKDKMNLKWKSTIVRNFDCQLYVGFILKDRVRRCLRLAFEIVLFVKNKSKSKLPELKEVFSFILEQAGQTVVGGNSLVMMRAADRLNIPYYQLDSLQPIFSYGQGRYSHFFSESLSDRDSYIGGNIQGDKFTTARLIKRIGYPATRQLLVRNFEQARKALKSLGFPIVVKPLSRGGGIGVTSSINNIEDFKEAYRLAVKGSRKGDDVIVENHVNGYDHRITVSHGKIIGGICRMPAMVNGDGKSSVKELIVIENKARPDEMKKLGFVKDIVIDVPLLNMLKIQKMDLDAVPDRGQEIILRSNANISTGGVFKDVVDSIHPDNMDMAIDIARTFRLDLIGLDFITTDIATSWKQEGAIIEVNACPGVLDELAESILKQHFSLDNSGRIPTTLIVSDRSDFIDSVTEQSLHSSGVGLIDCLNATLAGKTRKIETSNLYERCVAFLIDPSCEELFVVATSEEIKENGIPLDHFDNCYVDKKSNLMEEDEGLLKHFLDNHCHVLTVL